MGFGRAWCFFCKFWWASAIFGGFTWFSVGFSRFRPDVLGWFQRNLVCFGALCRFWRVLAGVGGFWRVVVDFDFGGVGEFWWGFRVSKGIWCFAAAISHFFPLFIFVVFLALFVVFSLFCVFFSCFSVFLLCVFFCGFSKVLVDYAFTRIREIQTI